MVESTPKLPSYVIDSSKAPTDLCYLGQEFGTDKSPFNVRGHRHPYTGVYSMLFAPLRKQPIKFAEIGVAMGASCELWNAYFTHPEARLVAFDRDQELLDHAWKRVEDLRYRMGLMDVAVDGDVARALKDVGGDSTPYDIILDDSSHNFEHQIRIVHEAWPLLRPGGMLIVEDIFKATPEDDYARDLADIVKQSTAAYFVTCEHEWRFSPGWDNDIMLVIVK